MSHTRLVLPLLGVCVSGLAAQSFLSNVNRFAGVDTLTTTNIGDNGPAYNATLTYPAGVAHDAAGNLYIAEEARIRKVDVAGNISTIAGNGIANSTGDGGPATAAEVFYAANVTLDSQGNIYFSEDQFKIRRIATDGTISTFAGYTNGYNGEGVPVASAGLSATGLAVDAQDQIYFADLNNARVRVVRQDGKVYTVAGTGIRGSNGENGPALQAQLLSPSGIAFDAAGNLYVADGRRVVRIDSNGILTRIAGDPSLPLNAPAMDEVLATSTTVNAISIATDTAGNIFVGTPRIRKITPDGIIHAVAGIENPLVPTFNFTEACGDALHASIYGIALMVDRTGKILVANPPAGRVQQITPDGRISTLSGAGPNQFSGDGGPATAATFAKPSGLAFDASGNLYIADSGNNRIRMIDGGGMVRTVVGDGGPTYGVDATCFPDQDDFLRNPQGLAFDAAGNLFIADAGKQRIRKIAADGMQSTVAASPVVSQPVGVAADLSGNLYVADSGYAGVFEITPQGSVTTVSTRGATGSLAFDAAGNLFIPAGKEVDRLGTDGSLSPVAGTGEYITTEAPGFENLSPPTEIAYASAVAVDAAGSLYAADSGKGAIQRVSVNCALSFASLQASGLAFDSQGSLYAADGVHGIIWQSVPDAVPPNEGPTPAFGFNAFRSAAVLPFIQPYGEPSLPAYAPPIAPGELLDIRGVCMGPIAPVAAHFDENGILPVSTAGVQLTANGIPVPLISVSSGEILAVAPYELDGSSSSTWTLNYEGATVSRDATVQAAQPAMFTQNGQGYGPAMVLNEGGSPNSQTNPAAKGALVAIYATGLGQTDPPAVDGLMATPPLQQPKLSVRVTIGGQNADVLDAGLAPGFVGLSQVDVRVPPGLNGQGALPVTLSAGSFTGMQIASPFVEGVTIWIAP